jgi:superfamily I DNA/RNA helicase
MLLAEASPDPARYLAAWDRLQAAEEGALDAAPETQACEDAAALDSVMIGTIHAAKGREYHAVVIPDYDCDVTRWSASQIEEERRVVYVGVTRARDTVLLTVNAARPYVHPFLRELVEAPRPGEHAALLAELPREEDLDAQTRLRRRVAEIEVLFPELLSLGQATRVHPGG